MAGQYFALADSSLETFHISNAPGKASGKRGFVKAVQDTLMFEDGSPARFWGTNLAAYALFGSPRRDDMSVQARRRRSLASI